MRGAGSRHWSLGASSSREPKADGGSLKCSHLRRQRQGGFWCILAGPGGVDGSRNLSPNLSHQHVLAKWQEGLSAWGHVWEGCSVHSLPHYMGFQIFTYVTIYTGMSEGKQTTTSRGTFKNRVTIKILAPWLTSICGLIPSIQWEQGKEYTTAR